ncbi:MAG: hypothetical protein JW850_00605 [Thermoflexales bacterium]|nr:hypothetical protein [Thermoflexales bacterium]
MDAVEAQDPAGFAPFFMGCWLKTAHPGGVGLSRVLWPSKVIARSASRPSRQCGGTLICQWRRGASPQRGERW